MNYLTLALRNLLRQRGRTGSALGAIAFGVIALVLATGFIEWILWAMREAAIESQLGHIQIMRPGYLQKGVADPYAYLLPERPQTVDAIERLTHVAAVAPRLNFSGLIAKGETTVSFLGVGVIPEKERVASRQLRILQGGNLTAGSGAEVVLGQGLAALLGAEVGDTVVLVATKRSGGISASEVRVSGIFFTSSKAYDDIALRVPISLARTLLAVEGSHTWVVALDDTRYTDQVGAVIKQLAGRGLDVVPWYEQAVFYQKTVALFSKQVSVVWGLILLVIVLSISNTMVMVVFERTRELGTMMALGFPKRAVVFMVALEGVMLGMVGGTIGILAGGVLALVLSAIGIPMPPPPGVAVGFDAAIRLTPEIMVKALVLAVVACSVASVLPAWRVSRLNIVAALR
ncbi:MAG TPA: ABC transporter permease [Gammaproteobacteria bacterium]|nr:ABC transporter permease [Gammaproteobacteria bacterium]